MELYFIIFISIALAFDAFSVSIVRGSVQRTTTFDLYKLPIFFGVFQSGMFILGWFFGENISSLVSDIAHWVAFAILSVVGLKMITEMTKFRSKKEVNFSNNYVIIMLSIATSIDAFAVGLSSSFLYSNMLLPALIIGTITFFLCVLGVILGKFLGNLFGRFVKFVGGIILIILGVKILIEH